MRSLAGLFALVAAGLGACSSETTSHDTSGSGGTATGGASTGGIATTSGGATTTGGATSATGGSTTGGSATGTGGADASVEGGTHDGGDDGATEGGILGPPIPPPVATGCVTQSDLAPGVHQVSCDTTVDVLTVPEQCTKTACGVIVDVHGGMMSSQMEDKNTEMSALGLKYDYIVIQPNALQNPILLNQRLFVADTPTVPADDTRVLDILNDVIQAFHADTKRIHMTGFSEGGFMTWRWFCKHSTLLASVAPGAAGYQCAVLSNLGLTPPEVGCSFAGTEAGADIPAVDIPVLFMQGSKDGLVDPACVSTWLTSNVFPALKLGAGTKIAGDATFTRTRYANPAGVPFEYITHTYSTTSSFLGFNLLGHCYPGSTDLTVTPPAQTVIPPDQLISFGCNDTCSFTWGEEVIRFFMAHPKP